MNEQFIILAEKLNNVASIAETVTPEVVQQTLEFSSTIYTFLLILLCCVALMTSVFTYKLFKLNSDEYVILGMVTIFCSVWSVVILIYLIEITYYPHSWLYSYFVG